MTLRAPAVGTFAEAPATAEERNRFAADVAFVGEGDGDRRPFLRTLLKALPDLDLALHGGLWELNPTPRRYHRGTVRGRDFRLALGGPKVAVNLMRAQNRDDHVTRSFEGPACGAFMLNEQQKNTLLCSQKTARQPISNRQKSLWKRRGIT
jgi:hypothetical protein